jgi:hypothetical protein
MRELGWLENGPHAGAWRLIGISRWALAHGSGAGVIGQQAEAAQSGRPGMDRCAVSGFMQVVNNIQEAEWA